MDFEPNYGSSEYSREAEELFARYLLEVENGAEPDLDALCAEHDDFADELYGLHADWDNVRGLLARLEGQRAKSAPPPATPEPQLDPEALAEREARVEPFSAADVPDRDTPEIGSAGTLRAVALAGVIAALALGLWSFDLLRTGKVLAKESEGLRAESREAREQLEDAEGRREALARREVELRGELQSTLAAKEQLEGESSALAQDLFSERERKLALEEERERLARELEAERERQQAAAAEVERLALRVEADDLLARERGLWPGTAGTAEELERWTADARGFVERLNAWRADGAAVPAEAEALLGTDGRLALAEGRLARLRAAGAVPVAGADTAWTNTLADLAATGSDSPYRGIELTPQFGLLPLGSDAATGLLRFADLRTGLAPGATNAEDAEPTPAGSDDDGAALVFVLVPGVELEGRRIEPFLVAESEWSPADRRRVLGAPLEGSLSGPIGERTRFELDCARFGFTPPTSAQVALARQLGVDVATWRHQPVRAIER